MIQTPRRIDRRKAGILVALVAALVLGLAACYPGGPENLDELGVVMTFKNPEGNFSGLMTYAMEDTVVELKKPNDDSSQPIHPEFNPTILEALQTQMENAGFIRVVNLSPPDTIPNVWLSVGSVESETWVYYYNWPYYGGYPGWGYYYPPYVSGTSFQQGTIIWQMHDLRGIDDPTNPDADPPMIWTGAINGALESSTSTTASGIQSGIQQGFAQSPYIAAQPAGK
jgi:hypothetical protein